MRDRTLTAAAAALAALMIASTAPASLGAQQENETREEATQEEQNLVAELQQIQAQLMQLREQAMQDAELQERQAEVQEKVTSVMVEIDPEAEAKVARANDLQQEMRVAQQEADQEKVRTLMQEAQQIQRDLQETQNQAMAREDVQEAVDEFRDDLFEKMEEIDPEAAGLIERARELTAQLQEEGTAG